MNRWEVGIAFREFGLGFVEIPRRIVAKVSAVGRDTLAALREIPDEITRNMNRFSHPLLTRRNLFTDVRKLRDVPVDGDELAYWVGEERAAADRERANE